MIVHCPLVHTSRILAIAVILAFAVSNHVRVVYETSMVPPTPAGWLTLKKYNTHTPLKSFSYTILTVGVTEVPVSSSRHAFGSRGNQKVLLKKKIRKIRVKSVFQTRLYVKTRRKTQYEEKNTKIEKKDTAETRRLVGDLNTNLNWGIF